MLKTTLCSTSLGQFAAQAQLTNKLSTLSYTDYYSKRVICFCTRNAMTGSFPSFSLIDKLSNFTYPQNSITEDDAIEI